MKNIIRPVKGTRDFYPEQMAMRTWLYDTVRRVSESFGYQEYEAPILESLNLYAAKSGEELVKKQAYVFTDRGGDEITLRPETGRTRLSGALVVVRSLLAVREDAERPLARILSVEHRHAGRRLPRSRRRTGCDRG